MQTAKLDLSEASTEAVAEIHRQGELCLQGTMQLALASDIRATTMAGVFGAGAVAIMAVIATLADRGGAIVWAALTTSGVLFLASLLCSWSARPTDFFVSGYEPKKLAVSASDAVWMLRYSAMDIQSRIDANRVCLSKATGFLKIGTLIAIGALPIGTVVYAILSYRPF